MRDLLRRIGNTLREKAFVMPLRRRKGIKTTMLGTKYGGYHMPSVFVRPGMVCYSAGVGEDVSFDEGLIKRFGCKVFAFDPTPRAASFVQDHCANLLDFSFYNIGVWSEDAIMKFYSPKNSEHVSHSIVNIQKTSDYFEAKCMKLSSIMEMLGHSQIDILKLDIEGAECAVLDNMISESIKVGILTVEFNQPIALKESWKMVKKLRANGYLLVKVDGWQCLLVRSELIS